MALLFIVFYFFILLYRWRWIPQDREREPAPKDEKGPPPKDKRYTRLWIIHSTEKAITDNSNLRGGRKSARVPNFPGNLSFGAIGGVFLGGLTVNCLCALIIYERAPDWCYINSADLEPFLKSQGWIRFVCLYHRHLFDGGWASDAWFLVV